MAEKERFWRIKNLKCYSTVYQMLMAGRPANAIARFIQEERREYTDIKYTSLSTMLGEYRRVELGDKILTNRMPHYMVRAKRDYGDRLEDLRATEDLKEMIMYHLAEDHASAQMGKPLPRRFAFLIKSLQDNIRLAHQIKMDLGLLGSRDLGTLKLSEEHREHIREKYGESAIDTLESPVSRNRILAAVNAAMRVAKARNGETDDEDYDDVDIEEIAGDSN